MEDGGRSPEEPRTILEQEECSWIRDSRFITNLNVLIQIAVGIFQIRHSIQEKILGGGGGWRMFSRGAEDDPGAGGVFLDP